MGKAENEIEREPALRPGNFLVFRVGDARCALPLASVREVVRAVAITPLPTAPPVVEGVVDVRGRFVPVLDLGARLGLPPRALRPSQGMVLADAGSRIVALRVDAIDWIERLEPADIAQAERIVHGAGYLAGVGRVDSGLVLLHDLERFLRQAEAEALDAALADREAAMNR